MKKYAIWKDKQVIGYIDLTEDQKETLNRTYGIGVYFGSDDTVNKDNYIECTLCKGAGIVQLGFNRESIKKCSLCNGTRKLIKK